MNAVSVKPISIWLTCPTVIGSANASVGPSSRRMAEAVLTQRLCQILAPSASRKLRAVAFDAMDVEAMVDFREKVLAKSSGILSYGLTPPRATHEVEKLTAIAARQRDQIRSLPVDAVVLYDLQDESSRDAAPRPFPFLPTLDPFSYARDFLGDAQRDLIVYRAVANHQEAEFAAWLSAAESAAEPAAVSFVGSPARAHQPPDRLTLP